jgi:excisionase family DNA binding protein
MDNQEQSSMDLLTTDEAAGRLRLSARTLEHWRETGEGPEFVKLGRAVRYTSASIDRYLAESQYRSTAEASETSQLLRRQSAEDTRSIPVRTTRRTRPRREDSAGEPS